MMNSRFVSIVRALNDFDQMVIKVCNNQKGKGENGQPYCIPHIFYAFKTRLAQMANKVLPYIFDSRPIIQTKLSESRSIVYFIMKNFGI